jgi:hypothetical protein
MARRSYVPGTPEWPGWLRAWRETFESEAAVGAERLVAGEGCAELLVSVTENALAVSRISAAIWDLAVRNLRIAGRADIDRLARQLASSEEKLEMLLQAVEQIHDERVAR